MSEAPKKKRSTFIRLIALILPYKGLILFSLICMVGFNIFTAAPVYYAKDIVDGIVYGGKPELKQYFLVGLGLIIVFGLKGLFFFGQNYTIGYLVQRLITKLRQRLFNHMVGLSFSFFSKAKTGDLVSRFTNDLNVFQNTLVIGVTGPFRDIPRFFMLLGIMFYRSWELSLVTLIIIPATLLFIHIFGLRNKKAVSDRQISFSELSTLVIETITGIRVVKAFGMEEYEKERINKASEELYSNHMRSIIIDSYSTPVIQVIGASAGATIVVYGGYLIIHGIITPGDFTSFILSFFMLNDPVAKMNGFNLKLQEGLAAIKRIFEIMDTEPDIVSKPDAKPFKSFEKSIELNVRAFHYPEQPESTLELSLIHI